MEDLYAHNVILLEKNHPRLAQLVQEVEIDPRLEMRTSVKGLPTLIVRNGDEKKVLLHSAYDPAGEAQKMIDSVDLTTENTHVVLGFGLGYLPLEMVRRLDPNHVLILVELDASIFKKALEVVDLAPLLARDQVKIVVGKDEVGLSREINEYHGRVLRGRINILEHPPSITLSPYDYWLMRKSIIGASTTMIIGANTSIRHGPEFMKNTIANTRAVMESAGVGSLFNKFQGKTAILVAAGPSLNKNVDLLREAKGKAVIISVGQAYRILLDRGIKPDIVTHIDFHEVSAKQFRGLPPAEDVALVYDQEIYPTIPSGFRGPKFVAQIGKPITRWVGVFAFNGEMGDQKKGMTVAHTSFFLARSMGADPIVFVGQDLSFPGERSHADGASTPVDINVDESYIWIDDIYGNKVPTWKSMYAYLLRFQEEISATDALCIDATEGGALIRGTKIMTLREVLDTYCQGAPFGVSETIEEAYRNRKPVDVERMIKEFRAAYARAAQASRDCEKGLRCAQDIEKLLRSGKRESPRFEALGRKLNKISRRVNVQKKLLTLLEIAMVGQVLYLTRQSGKETQFKDMVEKNTKELEKMKILFEAVRESSRLFLGSLKEALGSLNGRGTKERGAHRTVECS